MSKEFCRVQNTFRKRLDSRWEFIRISEAWFNDNGWVPPLSKPYTDIDSVLVYMKEDDEDIRFRIYPATLNVSIWWDTHWGTDITSSIGLTQHQSNRMSDKELLRGLKIIRWAKEFAQYHVDVMEVING